MKTKNEIIASLPERFREMDISEFELFEDINEANESRAFHICRYQELLKAFKTLVEKYS